MEAGFTLSEALVGTPVGELAGVDWRGVRCIFVANAGETAMPVYRTSLTLNDLGVRTLRMPPPGSSFKGDMEAYHRALCLGFDGGAKRRENLIGLLSLNGVGTTEEGVSRPYFKVGAVLYSLVEMGGGYELFALVKNPSDATVEYNKKMPAEFKGEWERVAGMCAEIRRESVPAERRFVERVLAYLEDGAYPEALTNSTTPSTAAARAPVGGRAVAAEIYPDPYGKRGEG